MTAASNVRDLCLDGIAIIDENFKPSFILLGSKYLPAGRRGALTRS